MHTPYNIILLANRTACPVTFSAIYIDNPKNSPNPWYSRSQYLQYDLTTKYLCKFSLDNMQKLAICVWLELQNGNINVHVWPSTQYEKDRR